MRAVRAAAALDTPSGPLPRARRRWALSVVSGCTKVLAWFTRGPAELHTGRLLCPSELFLLPPADGRRRRRMVACSVSQGPGVAESGCSVEALAPILTIP